MFKQIGGIHLPSWILTDAGSPVPQQKSLKTTWLQTARMKAGHQEMYKKWHVVDRFINEGWKLFCFDVVWSYVTKSVPSTKYPKCWYVEKDILKLLWFTSFLISLITIVIPIAVKPLFMPYIDVLHNHVIYMDLVYFQATFLSSPALCWAPGCTLITRAAVTGSLTHHQHILGICLKKGDGNQPPISKIFGQVKLDHLYMG